MTEKLPASAEWFGHTEDLVTHILSDYEVPEAVAFQLDLRLTHWLEANIEALVKGGRITLRPVRERVCRCWPCTVPLESPAPAPTKAGAPTSAQ